MSANQGVPYPFLWCSQHNQSRPELFLRPARRRTESATSSCSSAGERVLQTLGILVDMASRRRVGYCLDVRCVTAVVWSYLPSARFQLALRQHLLQSLQLGAVLASCCVTVSPDAPHILPSEHPISLCLTLSSPPSSLLSELLGRDPAKVDFSRVAIGSPMAMLARVDWRYRSPVA